MFVATGCRFAARHPAGPVDFRDLAAEGVVEVAGFTRTDQAARLCGRQRVVVDVRNSADVFVRAHFALRVEVGHFLRNVEDVVTVLEREREALRICERGFEFGQTAVDLLFTERRHHVAYDVIGELAGLDRFFQRVDEAFVHRRHVGEKAVGFADAQVALFDLVENVERALAGFRLGQRTARVALFHLFDLLGRSAAHLEHGFVRFREHLFVASEEVRRRRAVRIVGEARRIRDRDTEFLECVHRITCFVVRVVDFEQRLGVDTLAPFAEDFVVIRVAEDEAAIFVREVDTFARDRAEEELCAGVAQDVCRAAALRLEDRGAEVRLKLLEFRVVDV